MTSNGNSLDASNGHDLRCKHCAKVFSNTQGLRTHVGRKHPSAAVKTWKLSSRPNGIANTSGERREDGDQQKRNGAFVCPYCKREFRTLTKMLRHADHRHEKDRLNYVETAVCGDKETSTMIAVSLSFPCYECDRRFESASQVASHAATEHTKNLSKVSCDVCGRKFPSRDEMHDHRKNVHAPIRCEKCANFYSRDPHRMSQHETKCDGPGKSTSRDSFEVSRKLGRVMPADEDYSETKEQMDSAAASEESSEDDPGFSCMVCDFQHKELHVVLKHAAVKHTARFRAVTSNARVVIRQEDMEKANAKLAHDRAERNKEKTYTCKICGYCDRSMATLKQHVKGEHAKEISAKFAKNKSGSRGAKKIDEPKNGAIRAMDRKKNTPSAPVFNSLGSDQGDSERSPAIALSGASRKRHRSSSFNGHLLPDPKENDKRSAVGKPEVNGESNHEPTSPAVVFKCNSCGFKSISEDEIRSHRREVHSKRSKREKTDGGEGDLSYRCRSCDFRSGDPADVSRHVKAAHPKIPRGVPARDDYFMTNGKTETSAEVDEDGGVTCHLCVSRFATAMELASHGRASHLDEASDLYKCDACDYTTKYYKYLNNHVDGHPETADYKCHVCGHSATSPGRFVEHGRRAHVDEKMGLYKCPKCPHTAKYFKCLNKHALTCNEKGLTEVPPSGDHIGLNGDADEEDPLEILS